MQLDKQVRDWLTRTPGLVESLFDALPDVLFYVKDPEGRYLWANRTLIERTGLAGLQAVVGKTADQLFPVAGSSTMAQDLEVLQGKLVRLNIDGTQPADNPFADGVGVRKAIWSYGHRNMQGMAVDPRTGTLWQSEHGPRGGDELNLPQAGRNYGWPVITHGIN